MRKSIALLLTAFVSCSIPFAVYGGPLMPPGNISISYAAGQVTLSWVGEDVWLQSSPALFPNSWINVSNMPTINRGADSLTVPATQSAQFFRLVQSPNLPPPTELTLVPEEDNAGNAWFALLWDAVPLAISYNLYYAADPSVTQSNYTSLPDGGVLTGITNDYVTVSNLLAGVQYYFVATAVSTSGQSADSYPASGVFGQFGNVTGVVTAFITAGSNTFDQELQGVTVTLSNLNQPQLSSQAVSDQNGNYAFANQPAGTYQLCWSAPGFINGCLPDMVVITNEPIDGEDLSLTNDGSGLVFGHVTLADGSVSAQNDPYFGIQENVTVALGLPGQPPLQVTLVDSYGNYVMPGLPLQSGLTLTASNGMVGVGTNINVTGVQEVDFTLPETPPGIVAVFATSNGVYVTQAAQGTELQVTVVATNASGNSNGLHYAWVAGSETTNFVSVDSPIVNWTLPAVGGAQTMYVVVSDDGGGYATARLDVSTDLGLLFVGQVVDTNGVPVVGANVSINGQVTNSDDAGDFSMLVSNPAPFYTVVATQPGYFPSTMNFGTEFQNVVCVMVPEPPCQQFNSTTNIFTEDAAQSELFISANSLVNAQGGSPQQLICVTLDTLDPCLSSSQLSLSTMGVVNGTNVELEFLAMADVQAYDATGAPLQPSTNMPIQLNMVADTNCIDDLTNVAPSFWWYDEVAAVWRPAGGAVASTTPGGASSFFGAAPKAAPIATAKPKQVIPVPPPAPIIIPIAPPPPPMEVFFMTLDKTISLPVNVRILNTSTGALVQEATVFDRTVTVTVVRAPLTINVISPKEDPEVYPPTPLEANKTVIAQDKELETLPNNSVVTLGLSLQVPNLKEKRIKGSQQFLTFKFEKGSDDLAFRYYKVLDPNGKKTTLANWKKANGFGADTASATFFNACDLGFGRSMHMKTQVAADGNNDVAFYVANYRTITDVLSNRNLIATVAMDYVYNAETKNRVITFYVFNKAGNRVTFADLDGNGNKFVPNLCLVCHGGNDASLRKLENGTNPTGDLQAHFLAFDLDSYTYSALKNQGMANQEAGFLAMNQTIINDTDPTPTTLALVQGWYGGAALNKPFTGSFVPAGWMVAGNANIQATYSGAYAISCRSCHASRVSPALAFPTFDELNKKKDKVNDLVYLLPKEAQPMPNALRTFTIFWGSEGANVKGLNAAPPPDQTLLLQMALGLAGPRPAP